MISTNAGRHAIIVAVAFTAPISATGITAAATSPRRSWGASRGASVHGTSATGHASEEIAVSVVSTRGLNAYNTAATLIDAPLSPILRPSTTVPENAVPMTMAHQILCATQSGSGSVNQKNAPWGKR